MTERPDTLLMFSGGLDSTGAFWRLLQDKKILHVHHMHMKNIERRARAESRAVAKIMKYMKGLGNFYYSQSTHEYPSFNGLFPYDSDIVSFVAGEICMFAPWIKHVAIGMTASDSNPELDARRERASKIFDAFGVEATKVFPVVEMTKRQIFDMLPIDLRSLTWSCRTPQYDQNGTPIPCDQCQTCTEMKAMHND